MMKNMLLLAEMDAAGRSELEKNFAIAAFGKAAGNKDEVLDEQTLRRRIGEVRPEVAVIELELFNAEAIRSSLPELKLIACSRATPTNIDLAACAAHGVMVTNAPGRNANAVVEMTLGLVFSLARFIPHTHHGIRNRRLTIPPGTPVDRKDVLWQSASLGQSPYTTYRGIEVEERRLGLIGFGIIGRMMAPKAAALGMEVVAYDPFVSAGDMAKSGVTKIGALDEVFATSDFVSVHAKVTPDTVGMIGKKQFDLMKPDAYFINTSRGTLIDQDALVEVLRKKGIAGAALDVFDYEPQYHDSPLLELDNLIMTPHIGGATKDVVRHQSRLLLANITAYVDGREPPNLVKTK